MKGRAMQPYLQQLRTILGCQVALAALVMSMQGCRTTSSGYVATDVENQMYSPWAVAQARVALVDGEPDAVLIELWTIDNNHFLEASEAAFVLARTPGVVMINNRTSLHLPDSEGFQGVSREGNILILTQGYDPALSPLSDRHFVVTIPLRSVEARAMLRAGGNIVIHPNRTTRARDGLAGVAFQW